MHLSLDEHAARVQNRVALVPRFPAVLPAHCGGAVPQNYVITVFLEGSQPPESRSVAVVWRGGGTAGCCAERRTCVALECNLGGRVEFPASCGLQLHVDSLNSMDLEIGESPK